MVLRLAFVLAGLVLPFALAIDSRAQQTPSMPATPALDTNAAPAVAPSIIVPAVPPPVPADTNATPAVTDTNAAPAASVTTNASAVAADTNAAPVSTNPAPATTTTNAGPPETNSTPASTSGPRGKEFADSLVYRFDSCVFDTLQFPNGSFADDAIVRQFLAPVQVSTDFYNAQFQQVTTADTPGRYGAVVHIKLGDGTETTRFITLYRAPQKVPWTTTQLGLSMTLPPEWGIDPRIARSHRMDVEWGVKSILKNSLHEDSQLAIVLAGLSETKPGAAPDVYRNGWEARDTAWWFALKTKIGLEKVYPFLVYLPDGYDAQPDKRWPLILFLHGSGERGDSLPKVNAQGLPKLIAQGKKFPAIIISPQCPANDWWKSPNLSQLLDNVSAQYRIDPNRICVTGLSMGGFGTWTLALVSPDRFAAVVPICGAGDPPDVARLRKLPVWAFHGGKDDRVPIRGSIDMVKAIRAAGGHAHLTIFPNDGHDSWTDAYNTPALYTWILAQRRGHKEVLTPGVPRTLPDLTPYEGGLTQPIAPAKAKHKKKISSSTPAAVPKPSAVD